MVKSYTEYHNESYLAGDIDPSVTCLTYLADRYELNTEQRYWIAFLYGTCYSATTTFYMYNEFPDYELVDVNRLNQWWKDNKHNLIFQTDRLRIKSNDQFIESFVSYRNLCKGSQQRYFNSRSSDEIYNKILSIKYFGRFTLFNYLDVLNQVTDITLKPRYLNMMEAESCRNGLAFAIGREDLIKENISGNDARLLHNEFINTMRSHKGNIFQVETTLCAYKKYRYGKRYVGYYIDRMYNEIKTMEGRVTEGVAWEVLWQFREETYNKKYLSEYK
tara:strand:- start:20 stop:844 length:825 start_codon:yes stop_codon:yes gene_type:complete